MTTTRAPIPSLSPIPPPLRHPHPLPLRTRVRRRIKVHLPAPVTAYPVVPFEHTARSHANAAASAHLLADHIQGLSVSSRRQLGIILKKW